MELRPSLFCPFFCLLYFSLPPFKDLACFSGCLMSSAGIHKLFCGIYSEFKCSFDEFVGEKVFSLSYSSAILAPPPHCCFLTCIKISQEAGQVVWYSHLFQNFPQFLVIHTVKGFGIVNKAEIDVFSGNFLLFP